jgi:putative transposase
MHACGLGDYADRKRPVRGRGPAPCDPDLGKAPKVAYLDNGKAFKAKVFTDKNVDFEEAGFYGMFARLGIEAMFAWPYNAQSKVVERFFGTFNEVERLMPTYTGASIQDKPAHMMRNERLHKELHKKRYGAGCPRLTRRMPL